MAIWKGKDDPLISKILVSFYLAEQQVHTHSKDETERESQRRRDANK